VRHLIFACFLILFVQFSYAASSGIEGYIESGELIFYAPSIEELIATTRSLMKRFYSRNYEQMILQVSADSKSSYGIDVLDLNTLEKIGLNTKAPLSFVHISNNTGYLLLPVRNKKGIEKFIKNNLENKVPYRFFDNYVAFSEDKKLLNNIGKNLLGNNKGFALSRKKLNFDWDKFFVWIESSYLSGISSSIGVTSNIKLPYGFSAFAINFKPQNISIKLYSAIISSNQLLYMQSLKNVSASEKFDILDYVEGNPALVGNVYLNMPMLYKYFSYIDSINILGIKGLFNELKQKYKVNVENDLINNSDGRLKIVIDRYDSVQNQYRIYGSIGVKDPNTAGMFVESLKNAFFQVDGKLYSFDLFTKPFYHYKGSNYSIYYGVIENDLLFSTDKDLLTNLVVSVFENRGGRLEKMPDFFKNAIREKSKGYFLTIDLQSLFNNVKTGIQIDREFLIGVQNVYIYGFPDTEENAYGWNNFVDINFYP